MPGEGGAVFTLTIKTDNAAFEDTGELPRILRIVTSCIEEGFESGKVRDINGNTVGTYTLTEGD